MAHYPTFYGSQKDYATEKVAKVKGPRKGKGEGQEKNFGKGNGQKRSGDYFDNVMTKLIVNNRTDA